MNLKNFDYLKDQVKYTGFGNALEGALNEQMQKGTPEFQLKHSATFGNDTATATLHFKKGADSDHYFFNRYDLHVMNDKAPTGMTQAFYINKGSNITLKEAYNLMDGRAINKDLTNKEGQLYNAWVQMNVKETDKNGNHPLKQYHQNYGFDLEKSLAKLPIKELTNEQDKERLVVSLQRGNRQSVTIISEGKEQKMFIEANPRFKAVTLYDAAMQRVMSQAQKERPAPEQSLTHDGDKKMNKKGPEREVTGKLAAQRIKHKKQSQS